MKIELKYDILQNSDCKFAIHIHILSIDVIYNRDYVRLLSPWVLRGEGLFVVYYLFLFMFFFVNPQFPRRLKPPSALPLTQSLYKWLQYIQRNTKKKLATLHETFSGVVVLLLASDIQIGRSFLRTFSHMPAFLSQYLNPS